MQHSSLSSGCVLYDGCVRPRTIFVPNFSIHLISTSFSSPTPVRPLTQFYINGFVTRSFLMGSLCLVAFCHHSPHPNPFPKQSPVPLEGECACPRCHPARPPQGGLPKLSLWDWLLLSGHLTARGALGQTAASWPVSETWALAKYEV